ncbi:MULTISPECIES: DUF6580 family putative transport protein [Spirosoma]|uniref:Rod shape-determining protein MreD n=1 Tax=Spirosoma sordidisoli TaxID=2502893 RepID=A0A4Q2UPE5_9BACT|nr:MULTISPECIES: DUF6580 family putative transport protein [Spirosoma]RYC69485.1 hypothetical protein EQG79_12835 [Spirosoma sordidisoli]
MKPLHIRLTTLTTIVLATALFRILPHWPNVTPVAAVALFGAAAFERRWLGLVAPLAAMLLSDALIGFHSGMAAVYASFALTWLIGLYALRQPTAGRIAAASVTSSVLFFLITNFAVWFGSSFYPQTAAGLMSCYAAGLAFYNGTSFFLNGLVGDLFFSGLLFGCYYLLQQRFPVLRPAHR